MLLTVAEVYPSYTRYTINSIAPETWPREKTKVQEPDEQCQGLLRYYTYRKIAGEKSSCYSGDTG